MKGHTLGAQQPLGAQQLDGQLVTGGHQYFVRVFYEDTDFSTNVYHAAYLKFMERARSGFLRLRGVYHSSLAHAKDKSEALAFVVSGLTVQYIAPAYIDDVLEVKTSVTALRGARIMLAQAVFRHDQPIVSADVVLAVVDGTGRAKRLPDRIKEALDI